MAGSHERALEALERRGRLRHLSAKSGIDFSSNDYLGLAQAAELRDAVTQALARGVATGAGGSRLLRGNDPEHETLEAEAAAFFSAPTALYMGGGFMANYAIFSTLPERGDLIVHDALIHASVHDGMRASKAERAAAPHNDADAFNDLIVRWRQNGGTGRPWIAVESLYSMDGDRAPLDALAGIATRHDGVLVIDEAHATGVLGPDGRGLGAHLEGRDDVISLHTCGKALGAMGALVLAPLVMRDFLVNRCRPFIYATAPSPLMAAVVRRSLQLCREQPERRADLAERVAAANAKLSHALGRATSGSHIVPVVVGSDTLAVSLASALQSHGFDVRAVRPPTVPEGSARLRISITLNATLDEIRAMSAVLSAELASLAA